MERKSLMETTQAGDAKPMLRLNYRGRSRARSVTMPNWAFGLMAAGSAALGIAIFLVISAIAVVLLPLVLIAGGVTAFVMRKRIERILRGGGFPLAGEARAARPRRAAKRGPQPEIEDAEYRVVDEPPRRQP